MNIPEDVDSQNALLFMEVRHFSHDNIATGLIRRRRGDDGKDLRGTRVQRKVLAD